ncbi:MAG: hypothetical protein IPL61_31025 [Myxococcales bacterium]|nr:hypothetical protein [Myxococcales bacterium]
MKGISMTSLDFQTVPFEDVFVACQEIAGARPADLSPDGILACLPGTHLAMLVGAELMNDTELMAAAGLRTAPFHGQIYFVTQAGIAKGLGAFSVLPQDLEAFAAEHGRQFRERLFCGLDVIAVDSDRTTIWLYHHSGGYATIRRPGSQPVDRELGRPWAMTLDTWFSDDTSGLRRRVTIDSNGLIRHDDGEVHLGTWQVSADATAQLGALLGAPAITAIRSAATEPRGWCYRLSLHAPGIDVEAVLDDALPQEVRDVQVVLGQALRARRDDERAALGQFSVELTFSFRGSALETIAVDDEGQVSLWRDGTERERRRMPIDRVANIALLLRLAAAHPQRATQATSGRAARMKVRTAGDQRDETAAPQDLPPALRLVFEELYREHGAFRR